jgi:prepilin-type processing-associated H-X9-DG protein
LKTSLPGGYRPWTSWPPTDPRGGWAAIVLPAEIPNLTLWSCPAAVVSPVGNLVQTLQATSADTNAPACRYWLWRFDRADDPVPLTDFWGKSEAQAVSDLQLANDPTVGPINGASDVELVVDPYFPNTPTGATVVPPELKGRTIHAGGRNRVYLDGHTEFLRDSRTPLP